MNKIYFNVWFSAILQQQWTLQTNIIINNCYQLGQMLSQLHKY